MPNGWLFSSAQRRVLKSWPGAGLPLVKFERPNEVLDPMVDSETRLPQGPVWLCRIGTDGRAYEIEGRIVRPGRKYILLSEEALPRDQSLFAACGLDCDGISATLLSMPDTLSSANIAALLRNSFEFGQWKIATSRPATSRTVCDDFAMQTVLSIRLRRAKAPDQSLEMKLAWLAAFEPRFPGRTCHFGKFRA